jgi:hypothetical protein
MTFPRLPADRDLTAEERRGFRLACACMATFGRQLAADPKLGPNGRFLAMAAGALDLTIGQGKGTTPA